MPCEDERAMLWRESEHEPLTERFWTGGWAQEALQDNRDAILVV